LKIFAYAGLPKSHKRPQNLLDDDDIEITKDGSQQLKTLAEYLAEYIASSNIEIKKDILDKYSLAYVSDLEHLSNKGLINFVLDCADGLNLEESQNQSVEYLKNLLVSKNENTPLEPVQNNSLESVNNTSGTILSTDKINAQGIPESEQNTNVDLVFEDLTRRFNKLKENTMSPKEKSSSSNNARTNAQQEVSPSSVRFSNDGNSIDNTTGDDDSFSNDGAPGDEDGPDAIRDTVEKVKQYINSIELDRHEDLVKILDMVESVNSWSDFNAINRLADEHSSEFRLKNLNKLELNSLNELIQATNSVDNADFKNERANFARWLQQFISLKYPTILPQIPYGLALIEDDIDEITLPAPLIPLKQTRVDLMQAAILKMDKELGDDSPQVTALQAKLASIDAATDAEEYMKYRRELLIAINQQHADKTQSKPSESAESTQPVNANDEDDYQKICSKYNDKLTLWQNRDQATPVLDDTHLSNSANSYMRITTGAGFHTTVIRNIDEGDSRQRFLDKHGIKPSSGTGASHVDISQRRTGTVFYQALNLKEKDAIITVKRLTDPAYIHQEKNNQGRVLDYSNVSTRDDQIQAAMHAAQIVLDTYDPVRGPIEIRCTDPNKIEYTMVLHAVLLVLAQNHPDHPKIVSHVKSAKKPEHVGRLSILNHGGREAAFVNEMLGSSTLARGNGFFGKNIGKEEQANFRHEVDGLRVSIKENDDFKKEGAMIDIQPRPKKS
jgi:hypothetical protein